MNPVKESSDRQAPNEATTTGKFEPMDIRSLPTAVESYFQDSILTLSERVHASTLLSVAINQHWAGERR